MFARFHKFFKNVSVAQNTTVDKTGVEASVAHNNTQIVPIEERPTPTPTDPKIIDSFQQAIHTVQFHYDMKVTKINCGTRHLIDQFWSAYQIGSVRELKYIVDNYYNAPFGTSWELYHAFKVISYCVYKGYDVWSWEPKPMFRL